MAEIKFQELGKGERKILLMAINYDYDNLSCQLCKEKVKYDNCCILPSTDKRRTATILCSSPVCMSEYLNILGGGD